MEVGMIEGIRAIIQKIDEDARQHSGERFEQIKFNVEADIASENALVSDDIRKRREMLLKHNEHEYARLLERVSNRFNRELLAYRHALINEIYDMAVKKLRAVSREEFLRMFKSALKGLKGSYRLYPGSLSASMLDAEMISEAVAECDDLNISLRRESIPFKSGFILRDDRVELNYLFEDLIDDMKSENTAKIIKEVFENI
jgi:V/A-type H+-transporting ATPase subunit E